MVYTLDDIDKIVEFKTWSQKQKIDELEPGKDEQTASPTTCAEAVKLVREEYLAVQFFLGADPQRYGKLQEDIENGYTNGNKDNYPVTVNQAYEMLV